MRRLGFTILEILIALVVLGVSVLGVLALLVTSTKVAGEVVEDTFAATLARSTYEAARVAARERGFAVTEGTRVIRGFVLTERGMSNTVPAPGASLAAAPANFVPPPLPTGPADTAALTALRASDFTIFLPNTPAGTTGSNTNAVFVFPRPNGAATDNVAPGVDNTLTPPLVNARGTPVPLDVKRTYQLAHHAGAAPVTGAVQLSREAADQYSFAIIVRQAKVPSLMDATDPTKPPDWQAMNFVPDRVELSDGLYYLQIDVYRNFDPNPEAVDHLPTPKGRFMGLLAVGP
jgi:type II secretory pathway pseudopilin PulG